MDLRSAVLMPVTAGVLMWILDMLLPSGRLSRTALAVAGIMMLYALLMPVIGWLDGGKSAQGANRAYISAQEVLSDGGND